MNAVSLNEKYRRVYPDIPAALARETAEKAVEAANRFPELSPALEAWEKGGMVRDVVVPTDCSLLETAKALCPGKPDVPLACVLLALHKSKEAPGIPSAAGIFCRVDKRVFENNEEIISAFKADGEWVFLGKTAAEDENAKVEYEKAELWRAVKRVPGMLPLLLFPLFGEGTVIAREGGYCSVHCPDVIPK